MRKRKRINQLPSQKEPDIMSNKEHKQDFKVIRTKPSIKFKKEGKLDIKMMKIEPDGYKEEKAA